MKLSLSLLAFLVVVVVASGVASQEEWRSAQASAASSTWPPRPDDIVNVVGEYVFGKGRTKYDIYTVPDDKWLVMTEFRRIHTGNLDPELDLLMRSAGGGDDVVVLPSKFSETAFASNIGSGVGLKFPPSSTVALQRNERGSAPQRSQYFFVGYLCVQP